jgi:hypothetical protein
VFCKTKNSRKLNLYQKRLTRRFTVCGTLFVTVNEDDNDYVRFLPILAGRGLNPKQLAGLFLRRSAEVSPLKSWLNSYEVFAAFRP